LTSQPKNTYNPFRIYKSELRGGEINVPSKNVSFTATGSVAPALPENKNSRRLL
jgi:hypothetical protein